MNRCSRGPDGRTGHEEVTGNTPDISEWCDFEFCDLVWHRPHGKLAEGQDNSQLGSWIGVSHRVGSDMCCWMLPESGVVQSHTAVQHVTQEDHANADTREKIDKFIKEVKERLNDDSFELRTEHGTDHLCLDDEPVEPACPFADEKPDCEDDKFPEPM